jgi:DNA-binding beta-propeller fold protein YncE/phospholipase C
MKRASILAFFVITLVVELNEVHGQSPRFQAPAGSQFAKVVPGGTTILPNGRFLTPTGQRLYTGENLWNVVPSPDGKWVVGLCDPGIVVYSANNPTSQSNSFVIPWSDAAFCAAFSTDSSRLIVSSGDQGHGIQIFETAEWVTPATQRLESRRQEPVLSITADDEAHIIDIVVAPDQRHVYGADVARQKIVVFDIVAGTVVADIPAGREPFSLSLSEDGSRLFVANIGVFDYSLIPTGDGDPRGISRPAFGFPSEEAEQGIFHEGRQVPGLGDPLVADANSVWMIKVSDPRKPEVSTKVKTGILIHAPADGGKAVGGSSPNGLLHAGDTLLVANANNDTVQYLDSKTLLIKQTIKIAPRAELARLRGVIPSGMTLTKDGKTLFVCTSGLNAVAVIEFKSGEVINWIPTGWFPTACRLSPDEETLYVATQKGIGRGPRGSKHQRVASDERYGLQDMPGMIDAITLAELPDHTETVLRNNGMIPVQGKANSFPPEIKHVVFITKENHTFDGIFGGLEGSTGEPDYAEFGINGWISENGKGERLPIMPNHVRLAKQFAISDNFYMEPQASGDGHRWLVGVYPSLWTTRVFYSGWNFKKSDTALGRLTSFHSNGSQIPEDYLENGSLWEHLERGGITFRNFGEGFEFADNDEGPMTNRSGAFTQVNYPMPKVLFDNTDFGYPAYNTFIPDIARADWFAEGIENYRAQHENRLPRFINITLCNDHGASPMPKQGYPYVASYMADNDLALGKIVAYLSAQPEWKNMAIIVTQDDSGGDNDSVDRHRSYVLCISPWAKRNYVSHEHTSIMSIIKTIYSIFDLGPNNLFDATATDLHDMFTNEPNFEPFKYVPVDPRVFKPEDTFDPTDPKFERRRKAGPAVKMDDPDFVEWLRNRDKE